MLQNEKLFQLFNSISDNSEIYRLSPSSTQHDLLDLVCLWTYRLYLQWLCRVWMVVTGGDVFPSS